MTLEETKAYLRVTGSGENETIGAMLNASIALCETWVGGPLVQRELTDIMAGYGGWHRLSAGPVQMIDTVSTVDEAGTVTPLSTDRYALDIDASGAGWVKVTGPTVPRVQVRYIAGLAATAADVPATLAHGVVRLAAHFHMERDDGAPPPAAVIAMWRPWRRLRIDGGRDDPRG